MRPRILPGLVPCQAVEKWTVFSGIELTISSVGGMLCLEFAESAPNVDF
jgi:hypothetical protein